MRRARAVLIVAACLAFALLGLLGVGLAHAQANDRADIEQNLHQRAVLTAALLDSVFQSVAGQATQAPSLYATGQVNAQVLDDHVANARYLAVTDGAGKVLAASSGFDAQTGRELSGSAAMRTVLSGAPWGVGDVEPYRGETVVDIAIAFTTPYGGRVVVVGADPAVFGVFATPELRSVPGVPGAVNTLLDSNDVVLATTSSARPGQRAPASKVRALVHPSGAIDGWYFEQAPLADTTLRVVLSAPEGALFAPVSGAHRLLPWLLLAACAAVAAVALVLGGAALRAGTRLRVLNQRLGSLNAELRLANVQLEQHATELAHSNEELDQFASIASHDLQEPLRKVRTYTQQLAVMEGDSLSEKGHEYLWRANAAGARMQTLIEDLLRYAQLGTQGRAFEPVDLARLAAEVIDDLGAQIDEAAATVTVGALPTIQGDEPQLRQLLQNLVSNAVKFRREDRDPEVSIEASRVGTQAQITVRDNGIGFDPRYSQRIFGVFERLHGRNDFAGTGIGLALCRKIVERHGGVIRADAEEGAGATFTIVLPATQRTEMIDIRPLCGGRVRGDQARATTHV